VKNEQIRTVYTDETIGKIFEAITEDNPCYLPALFCYYAGCRKGEAFGIAWKEHFYSRLT
jgi:integrase